jgi:glutathione S-transferase
MKLFGYWRSSAAYRVRIALNLKQLSCEHESVHLVKNGGEQHSAEYQSLNPNKLVPT